MITYQLDKHFAFMSQNADYPSKPYLSVLSAPPAVKQGFTAKWETELCPIKDLTFGDPGTGQWVEVEDNRGVDLYNTTDGSKYEGEYGGVGELPEGVTTIARPSESHTWQGGDWWIDPSIMLEQEKNAQVAKVDAWVREKEYEPIEFKGDTFRGEQKDRDLLSGTLSTVLLANDGEVPDGLVWRSMTNVNHVFTADDYKELVTAFAMRTQTIYAQSWAYKEQIRACTSQADLDELIGGMAL